jgi:hypothetical protein
MNFNPLSNCHEFREQQAKLGIMVLHELEDVILITHKLEGAYLKNEFIIDDRRSAPHGKIHLKVMTHCGKTVTLSYPWPEYEIWSVALSDSDTLLITFRRIDIE